jgi:hypothetical protein
MPTGLVRAAVDHLREHRSSTERDEDADTARKRWLRDTFRVGTQDASAGRAASERSRPARAGERGVEPSGCGLVLGPTHLRGDRDGDRGDEQREARKRGLAHRQAAASSGRRAEQFAERFANEVVELERQRAVRPGVVAQ